MLKGHPATGKSTLALALARRLAWPLIDKDDIKDYTYQLPQGNLLAYDIMWQLTRQQLEVGLSVVVDSPLSYQKTYATGQALAKEYGARIFVVETALAEAHWQQRLDQRLHEPPNHRVAGWENMQKLLDFYDSSWRFPIAPEHHLVVDTNQSVEQNVQQVIERLQQ
jgi:predicted kinase